MLFFIFVFFDKVLKFQSWFFLSFLFFFSKNFFFSRWSMLLSSQKFFEVHRVKTTKVIPKSSPPPTEQPIWGGLKLNTGFSRQNSSTVETNLKKREPSAKSRLPYPSSQRPFFQTKQTSEGFITTRYFDTHIILNLNKISKVKI